MNILITGATSGIGQACAELFSQQGHRVIITGRRADRLAALQAALPSPSHALCFDVSDKEATHQALNSIPEEYLPIHLLINNAGKALGLSEFADSSLADWEEMLDVNVRGMLYVAHWTANHMRRQGGGHIINVGSVAGREVYPKGHVYCGTKHAVDAITRGMRQDLVPYGIKVSQVAPGMVETEFSQVRFGGNAERARAVYTGMQPLTGADVAQTIAWMAAAPAHVNIADVLLLPATQASSTVVVRKS
ncbi:MAG: SDR family NAD(P)-dependent oxidoreductase [Bacteroidetes bacterium]|nr:SDR family NAD(P)-dependent oxidoreductase [Bacteroidota bacterium]